MTRRDDIDLALLWTTVNADLSLLIAQLDPIVSKDSP